MGVTMCTRCSCPTHEISVECVVTLADGNQLLVKGIPTWKCDHCGNEDVTWEIREGMRQLSLTTLEAVVQAATMHKVEVEEVTLHVIHYPD